MAPYSVIYEVQAVDRTRAILTAGAKLPHGVRFLELVYATPAYGPWWNVEMVVEETVDLYDPEWPGDLPEQADEVTMAKAEHARFGL